MAAKRTRHYWLFKSEPTAYSIDDLQRDGSTFWDGVRNYQARNMLRDDVQPGDRVFFYHSNAKPMGIVGTMEVIKAGYPDHTAFDPNDHHYDAGSDPDNPRWYMVDLKFLSAFETTIDRDALRANAVTADMMVLRKGSRLSIQPVTEEEWKAVHEVAGARPPR